MKIILNLRVVLRDQVLQLAYHMAYEVEGVLYPMVFHRPYLFLYCNHSF